MNFEASKLPRMWLMSWPKLKDRWKTLLILTQLLKGSNRWQGHQGRRKTIKIENLDSKPSQFLKILIIIWW
jgi:hypothetical protein